MGSIPITRSNLLGIPALPKTELRTSDDQTAAHRDPVRLRGVGMQAGESRAPH